MAEALINHLSDGSVKAESAGSHPTGSIHYKSIAILQKHGIGTSGLHSKSWDVFARQHFDLVITVCDVAAGESCPMFSGNYEKHHWNIPDPAATTESEEAINIAFDKTFIQLKQRIEEELL